VNLGYRPKVLSLALVASAAVTSGSCRNTGGSPDVTPQSAPATTAVAEAPPTVPSAPPDPFSWAAAIARIEEVRGSAGRITTPAELHHHDDRRRFLAVQMADSHEESYDLPHDVADLAQMIQRGQLVGLRALGDDHILYDVGTDAREDPLAHYDLETGKDVPLFPSMEAYEAEDARLAAANDRDKRELLASYYRDPARAEMLFGEHRAVTALAANFDGIAYDLSNPDERTRFQVRLLSFLRPEARDVVLQVARVYHQQFGRLLPISSLVRTERYQRRLSRVNRNAARVDIPPHATGMAFDISYKFMAADEQNFIMEHVARLESEGRVEALRENRNAIHVYTFAGGQRPSEPTVTGFLSDVEDAHPGSALKPAPKPKAKPTARRAAARGKRANARPARPRTAR
jgi:Family of unknown function (DUF5715)